MTLPTLYAYASRQHYLDHLRPVVEALRDRGVPVGMWTASGCRVEAGDRTGVPADRPVPVLVASHADGQSVGNRPLVLMEHGAGQSYRGPFLHPAYAGGRDRVRDRVLLFVCPGRVAAAANRFAYPLVPTAEVGCPRLDPLHRDPPPGDGRTVAFAFHWDASAVAIEAGTAWEHFAPHLAALAGEFAAAGLRMVGHGHPRAMHRYAPAYRAAGVEVVDEATVMHDAAVLVFDNTSLGWEFASTGRPVALLDHPLWRHEVEHGLRFWRHADAGPRTADPRAVAGAVALALADVQFPERRAAAVADVYAATDGHAAGRAADAIRDTISAHDHDAWLAGRRSRMGNPRAPRRRRAATAADGRGVVRPQSAVPPDPPRGTIAEVLKWAGDDPARLGAALAAERRRTRPRPLLLRELASRGAG